MEANKAYDKKGIFFMLTENTTCCLSYICERFKWIDTGYNLWKTSWPVFRTRRKYKRKITCTLFPGLIIPRGQCVSGCVVRTSSNESERYSSRLRHRNALTENKLGRQREQREQSIYQLFWYLSANIALGIYFKNSPETNWSQFGPMLLHATPEN